MDDLIAQLDSREQEQQPATTQSSQLDHAPKQTAKSRFIARQARKAVALAQAQAPDDPIARERLQNEIKQEEETITSICKDLGFQIFEIPPDGHCLFSAVADQLSLHGVIPSCEANYTTLRRIAVDYMQSHPNDFIPFLPTQDVGNVTSSSDTGLMTPDQFKQYCTSMRDTAEWGGEPEIMALSNAYHIPIHVVQGGKPPIIVHQPPDNDDKKTLYISYHRRQFGLGEHYNSLRPHTTSTQQ
ncbi:hypothetical protein AMATHDRAFT_53366 [Amanita thiersii Skay4041]|uniref:OTU domain-containing protein n=1 Tax=Amanita thiersii Skay4041 TaxID=703135 RepID=A0A2A9NXZ0_9AGAR|nr:hypothetical protein AMATHDRAFT_53366 [Amanita thiersii Skay4041]